MYKTLFIVPFLLTFILSLTIQGQTPQPNATPPPLPEVDNEIVKISTSLIQVDVTVTDKKGNIIKDLRPDEFEVYENGKKQEITNFSFILQGGNSGSSEKKETPAIVKGKGAIAIPPIKLKPEQVRRTYALVVDDLGISFENIFWTQQTLKKFVNEQMLEGDLVAIIRTGSGIGALQSFTSDKRQLLAAIDKIKWNSYGRGGISTFSPIEASLKDDLNGTVKSDGSVKNVQGADTDKEFERQIDEFRNDNFSVGTLGALSYIINGMRELPGRKSIMLVTEGFVFAKNGQPTRVFDSMKVLADMANRASVVIYTLDPRGLQAPGFTAQDVVRDVFSGSPAANALITRESDFRDSQQSLRYLSDQTGGVPFVNQNNLTLGLQRALDDQNGYYLLGYKPDEDTFDPKKNRFNKLEVRITRPDLKVRYRSGFFGITDEKIQNIEKTPQQKLAAALTSPFGASGINLSLYPVFQNDAKEGNIIHTLVYIDANDLKFSNELGKLHKANFEILAMTFGDNGSPINRLSKTHTIEVGENVYKNILENGFIYTITMPIKKAGAYQFRIALRDTSSNEIGSVSQFIDVPNVKKKLGLSNIILDEFTPDELKKMKSGENTDGPEKNALLDSTLRKFKGGTILRYDYVIYDPKNISKLETQIRLIRNGKVIYEEDYSPVNTDGQSDLGRIQAAGAISLGKNLEPGDYVLQIVVADTAKEKRFATQYVEFEILK